MTVIQAIIMGVVEGITEFLPISSTGHLILTAKLMRLADSEFLRTFEIAIQSGAILSVIALYWRRFLIDRRALLKIGAAFLPTAVLGLVFYKTIKKYLLGSDLIVIWMLILGGIFILAFERAYGKREAKSAVISYRQAVVIGLCQSLAFMPGVSRALATIFGGMAVGLPRKTAVEFSFLLAVPTMLAATCLDLVKSSAELAQFDMGVFMAGFLTSFAVAVLFIKLLVRFIQNHDFTVFGIYRIAAGILFLIF